MDPEIDKRLTGPGRNFLPESEPDTTRQDYRHSKELAQYSSPVALKNASTPPSTASPLDGFIPLCDN